MRKRIIKMREVLIIKILEILACTTLVVSLFITNSNEGVDLLDVIINGLK